MSNTKSFFCALALAALGVAGCGGSGNTTNKTVDLAQFIVSDFSEPPADMAKVCAANCTSDTQCQNTCATPSSGVSCCDTSTHTCYTNAQSVCPSPPDMSIPTQY